MEKAILFISHHNLVIIQSLAVGLALLIFIFGMRLFLKGSPSSASESGLASSESIEKLLKEVLEKSKNTVGQFQNSDSGSLSSENSAQLLDLQNEIKQLQEHLIEKQNQIEEAKSQAQSAMGTKSNQEELESRLKELEAKLTEYEIIAEDIADLSKFREENVVLKNQIKELQQNSANTIKTEMPPLETVESEPTPAPPPSSAQEDLAISDDIMAEFAKAVEDQKSATSSKNKIEVIPQAQDDDLIDKILSGQNPMPAQSETPPPVEVSEPPLVEQEETDAQFNLDMMVNEASQLEQIQSVEALPGENQIEKELDPDKLALEAGELEKLNPDDEALLNKFESFKKEQS